MARCDACGRWLTLALFLNWMHGLPPTEMQLITDADDYKHLVEAVHTIFNNTCVIFMYTAENPMQSLGLYEAEQLMSIPLYIARLHVRTFAYAIKTFKESIGNDYFNLKRPLFILLNDFEEMRQQYSKEIAPWISMAYINWVIFFRDNTSVEYFFSDIYVPLDCIFLVARKTGDSNTYVLTEVYHIAKGRELLTAEFGTWNEERGLSITKFGLYQRRSDLMGQLIRVTSIQDPPVSLIEHDAFGQMMGIKGFFGTILQILEENLNCTFVYTECKSWGSKMPNGSWSGAIGMLVRNESDLAAIELLMTADRLEVIEFTTPVFSTKSRTFIKRPYYTAVKWTAYSDPFYAGIWLSLLAIMLLSSAFILIGVKLSSPSQLTEKELTELSFADTLFHIFGAICAQGHESVEIDSIRIINLVIHMTGVIILAAYSAALISFLAVKVFIMPFTSMEGLLEDGSYKFGVVRDSADYSFFERTSDKLLQRMFQEILDEEKNLPRNYLEGLNNLCLDEKYAFMITDNMYAILAHQVPCILEPLEVIMQTTMAMAVPKRSPYRGIINSNILLMRDSGVLQRVIATEMVISNAKSKDHWTSVEIIDVCPLLLLILGGLFFGLTFLFCEKLQYAKCRKNFKSLLIKKLSKQKSFAK